MAVISLLSSTMNKLFHYKISAHYSQFLLSSCSLYCKLSPLKDNLINQHDKLRMSPVSVGIRVRASDKTRLHPNVKVCIQLHSSEQFITDAVCSITNSFQCHTSAKTLNCVSHEPCRACIKFYQADK